MSSILLLEDDEELGEALCIYLQKAGYEIRLAGNCRSAEIFLTEYVPDIVIADIMVTDGSGLEFGKTVIEKSQIPVVFLTAKDDESDILKGYEAGCEEYVTKPLSPRILEKKIATILKRQKDNPNTMCYKKLKIDYDKKRVWHGEEEVHLTSREWKILELLAKNQGKIVTKEVILEQVWDIDENFVDTHAVTVVINRLRKKIENNMTEPVYIRNVFGVGYTFGE